MAERSGSRNMTVELPSKPAKVRDPGGGEGRAGSPGPSKPPLPRPPGCRRTCWRTSMPARHGCQPHGAAAAPTTPWPCRRVPWPPAGPCAPAVASGGPPVAPAVGSSCAGPSQPAAARRPQPSACPPPARSPARPLPLPPPRQGGQALLKDQLELVKVRQADGSTRYSIKPLEAEFSFDKGFFMFVRAIQLLMQHNKDTILVRAWCWVGAARRGGGAAGDRGRGGRRAAALACSGGVAACAAPPLPASCPQRLQQLNPQACLPCSQALGLGPSTGGSPTAAPTRASVPPAPQVGLAGPSGSGKTAFSAKIKAFIPGCALLSMDNYNDGSKVIDGNFDGALWVGGWVGGPACVRACGGWCGREQ